MKTSIDEMKTSADILIKYANGGSYTIKNQTNVDLGSARGIRRVYDNGYVEVTERKLTELQRRHSVACDF